MNTALVALLLAAAPAPAPAPLADLPFDDAFGLVFFDASIGDSGPLSFLLDTGFDTSVLNADTAARLGMKPSEVKSEAAPGGAVEVGTLPPMPLGIGALRLEGVRFGTVPLTPLAGFVGRPIDGILGHDVLESRVVEIDYPARRLRFRAPEGYENDGPGQVLPVTFRDSQALVTAGVEMPGGRTVFASFKLDTGSLDVAGLNLNFVRDNRLIGPGIAELGVRGVAVGGDTENRLFRAAAFVLGTDRVERPLLGYTVDSSGFENRLDAGTIGGALLSRYRLILDYPRHRIILEAGHAPAPRVREDLAGALLTSTGPDFRTIVIAQVIAGTPAAEAGLAAGDEIVTAGGRPVSLRAARELLEEPGPLALLIRREGQQRAVRLDRRPVLP